MKHTVPAPLPRAPRRRGAGSLAFLLTAASALPLLATPPCDAPSAPPVFPDEVHVMNGCFISTAVYVAKFRAAFPAGRALPLTVRPANYEGPHTAALLTWEGRWWVRDEYFGVFRLACAANARMTLEAIGAVASRALEAHSTSRVRAAALELDETRRRIPVSERAREIAVAAAQLPCASEIFWARSGSEEIPFLFFHPAAGEVAVYDPLTGTSSARCACTDGAKIVAAIAARIGYRVDALRRENVTEPAALVASPEMSPGGLAP